MASRSASDSSDGLQNQPGFLALRCKQFRGITSPFEHLERNFGAFSSLLTAVAARLFNFAHILWRCPVLVRPPREATYDGYSSRGVGASLGAADTLL